MSPTAVSTGRPVTLWLRRDVLARVDAAARRLGLTRSAFVRIAATDAAAQVLREHGEEVDAPAA